MAHLKTLFILSLLFAVVLLISSKASAAGNEPAGVAQTQVDAEVGDWHEGGGWRGGGGGWRGGGGGWRGGGGGWHGGGGGGGWHGGGGGWHRGGGWRGGGWRGGGGGCHYPYCKNVAGGDAQTEAKSEDGHIP